MWCMLANAYSHNPQLAGRKELPLRRSRIADALTPASVPCVARFSIGFTKLHVCIVQARSERVECVASTGIEKGTAVEANTPNTIQTIANTKMHGTWPECGRRS